MSESLPTLFSQEKLRALTIRALDILYECQDIDPLGDDDEEYERSSRRLRAAMEALRFCASAAALHRDTSLLPLLIKGIEILGWYNDEAYSATYELARGIRALLRLAPPLPAETRSLVSHENAEIRAAVAGGLQPRGEEEVELLELLSADPVADVRNAAQKSLSSLREIPWWRGKFSQDPAALLRPEDAAALQPTFEELSRVLDASYLFDNQGKRLTELAGLLPDALLFDLAKTCLSGYDFARLSRLVPFLVLVLRRPGGGALLCELLVCWSAHTWGHHTGWLISRALSELPVEARVAVCQALLDFIVSADPPEARASYHRNPYKNAAEAVQQGWPAEVPPEPILAALASLPEIEESPDASTHALGNIFQRKDIDLSPFFDEMIEAYLSRDKGRFRHISYLLEKALDQAPHKSSGLQRSGRLRARMTRWWPGGFGSSQVVSTTLSMILLFPSSSGAFLKNLVIRRLYIGASMISAPWPCLSFALSFVPSS